jgi:hypothetical protein
VLNRAVRIAIQKLVEDAVETAWDGKPFEAWFHLNSKIC